MPAASPRSWREHVQAAWLQRNALTFLLWPLSLLYGIAWSLRKWLFGQGFLATHRVPVPVVVVGNVVAGGAGKTPVVIALVERLQSLGWHPGVISRGHGRHSTDCVEVLHSSPLNDVGDEPALIKYKTGAPVFVAAKRPDAARALLKEHPSVNILVADDGLQHLALHRDIEVCVFDDRGIGNGLLLPAGPLREPWPRQVDLILNSGQQHSVQGFKCERHLASYAVNAAGQRFELQALAMPGQTPLLAVAAIAQPEAFFAMLRAVGLPLAKTLPLPDHYDFDSWVSNIHGSYKVICTEKDAVKIWPQHPDVLAVPLFVEPDPMFFVALAQCLGQLAPRVGQPVSLPHGHPTT